MEISIREVTPQSQYQLDTPNRGARDPIGEEPQQIIAGFVENSILAVEQDGDDAILAQREAYSDEEEDVRDEAVHRLGLFFGFDLDEALTQNEINSLANPEIKGAVVIEPAEAQILGLDPKPDGKPHRPKGINRTVEFSKIRYFETPDGELFVLPDNTVKLSEREMRNTVIGEDGSARERMLRIMRVGVTDHNNEARISAVQNALDITIEFPTQES